jgi:hypothetical protein
MFEAFKDTSTQFLTSYYTNLPWWNKSTDDLPKKATKFIPSRNYLFGFTNFDIQSSTLGGRDFTTSVSIYIYAKGLGEGFTRKNYIALMAERSDNGSAAVVSDSGYLATYGRVNAMT